MAKAASKNQRTISSEVMNHVMTFVPQDGMKLTDDILNKTYTVTGVRELEFGKAKSFVVTAEDDKGAVVNLSAGLLKRARVLGKSTAKIRTPYKGTQNCIPRSQAEEIWNSSTYFHQTGEGMKKNEDFVIPEKLTLRCAVLGESRESGQLLINPALYKGYNKVVAEYQKRDAFPTWDDFKAELQKTEDRIAGLPASMTEPTLYDWVKEGEVSNYRYTLILSDDHK